MPTDKRKYWAGDIPPECNFCSEPIINEFIDAATRLGWMLLCPECHKRIGFGLGTGLGQRYIRLEPDKWFKDVQVGKGETSPKGIFETIEFPDEFISF